MPKRTVNITPAQQEKKGKSGLKDAASLIVAIIICQLAGAIGALFTMPSIPTWYARLSKPFFSPPNWVFGPVWFLLYTMMGAAAYLVWKQGIERARVRRALAFFAVQLALNALWSAAFFGLRSPFSGFAVITVLWIVLAVTMIEFYRVSKTAGLLLVPYLLWTTFAAALNFSVALMNP